MSRQFMKNPQSGDKVSTLAGTTVELPYANEHPCFGNRQGWCANMATKRMTSKHMMLHFCDKCSTRPSLAMLDEGMHWQVLTERPKKP